MWLYSLLKYPHAPVLDVGTGGCACLAHALARMGRQVVALDNDHKMMLQAQKHLNVQENKKCVQLLQSDITALGLASRSFRNIVCFNVLHHIPRINDALNELHRILTSKGRLIISEYDENKDGFLIRLEQSAIRKFRNVALNRRPSGRLVLICEK